MLSFASAATGTQPRHYPPPAWNGPRVEVSTAKGTEPSYAAPRERGHVDSSERPAIRTFAFHAATPFCDATHGVADSLP
jgi:hypothetical protein